MKRNAANNPERGFALILTLMIIALIAVVIVAFFASIRTEMRSGSAAGAGQSARQLADMAMQVAQSQIQSATTQGASTAGQLPSVAWASQPGMIRCYDNNGNPVAWYKLYSAQNMVVKNPIESGTSVTADLPTANWAQPGSPNYGIFTDLNSPVISQSGALCYPIVDPSGARSMSTTGTAIAGFDISQAPGYVSTSATSATNNPAAMPVRWLYVLRSGALVPGAAGQVAGQVSVPGASGTNPIVGRVAFWTDDETCKLNINTAADGTYFDTPRFDGPLPSGNPSPNSTTALIAEKQLAITPPTAGEYQRYVGHPAQTRLSTVLPALASLNTVDRSHAASLLSPFMQWGGSSGGTVTLWATLDNGTSMALAPATRRTPYASVDEWLFGTGLSPATSGTYRVENANLAGTSLFDLNGTVTGRNHLMNELHFFLSASSEAPEVNLFGQPRIAMWPINADLATSGTSSPYVTTFDKMLANAASLNTNTSVTPPQTPSLYYFQRKLATSSTNDYLNIKRNQQIYGYLETLANSPIPGYGGTFDGKYQAAEMDQILTEIFDYIRCTNPTDPMLTGTANSLGQITTNYTYAPGHAETYYNYKNSRTQYQYGGYGQVVPTMITGSSGAATKGFGRFDTISEITMDFTRSQQACLTGTGNVLTADPNNTYVTGLLYLGLYSPALGPDKMYPDIRVEVDGLGGMMVTTGSAGSQPQPVFGQFSNSSYTAANPVASAIPLVADWNNGLNFPFLWGGVAGPRPLTVMKWASGVYVATGVTVTGTTSAGAPITTTSTNAVPSFSGTTTTYTGPLTYDPHNTTNYKFAGIPIKMGINDTISLSNTPLTIKVYYANLSGASGTNPELSEGQPGNPSDLVQQIQVTFPGFSSLPVPTTPNNSTTPLVSGTNAFTQLSDRLNGGNYGKVDSGQYNMPIMYGDIVRSLVVGYNGDMRMTAAQSNISVADTTQAESAFTQIPGFSGTATMLHSQRDVYDDDSSVNDFTAYGFTAAGQLVPGGYAKSVIGLTDTNATTSGPSVTGDWDNGLSIFPDGPYIGKPDEVGLDYYYFTAASWAAAGHNDIPYFTGGDSGTQQQAMTYSSPNRTIPSPVSFGSLPTGVPVGTVSATPWRTLLFRPQSGHFGESSPEDEMLLDWFWMPVVEPYSISTPMATAGKVNMNYQIAPFSYITRATALLGVLGSEYVIAVPTTSGSGYAYKSDTNTKSFRYPISLLDSSTPPQLAPNGTMRQFTSRFANGQIFKSASEICDIYLVPQDTVNAPNGFSSNSDAETYWAKMKSTGDNTRERPYNGLYSRLTTKSNTYTVHVRAQALAPGASGTAGVWVESPSNVLSEYRGSYVVNRYIDPGDTAHPLPDFVTNPSNSLDAYYKYRILETRRFIP